MSDVLYHRRCIKITALDSPNVQHALWQQEQGLPVTGEQIVPGVLSWANYVFRKRTMNKQRIKESLEAEWYEGAALFLVPQEWIDVAVAFARTRPAMSLPRWMGIDPAEGGDDTCWCIIDRYGILHLESIKTPDTNVVFGKTLDLMRRWQVRPEDIVFDRAFGLAHADRMRAEGYGVRTVDFGMIKQEPKRGMRHFSEKKEMVEDKGEVVNRRSQMYLDLHYLLERPVVESDDPIIVEAIKGLDAKQLNERVKFALPMPMCAELIRQLKVVPLTYDALGKFKLIPKQNPDDGDDPKTFTYLIGRSPDEADAFAIAVHGMNHKPPIMRAGGA